MKKFVMLTFFTSTCIASFVLLLGISHNSMGEYCRQFTVDGCDFDFVYAIFTWLNWFILVFLLQHIIFICLHVFMLAPAKKTGRRKKKRRSYRY